MYTEENSPLKINHKPLLWLHNLKEPNCKLQRWKIKLNEFDFDIEHIKGKENAVADGLSRVERQEREDTEKHYETITTKAIVHVNANEIDDIEPMETNISSRNTSVINMVDESDLESIHSADTDITYFIPITEKPLNIFKNQIILSMGNKEGIITTKMYNKIRKEVILSENTDMIKVMREILPEKGFVAVFVKNFSLFLKFQDLYREYFARSGLLRILKTSTILEDVNDKEVLLQKIETEHLRNNHRGAAEIMEELKSKIYYPNLYHEILKHINNCEVCQLAKYDRNPIKYELNITKTATKSNEIVHVDLWYPQRGLMYLTTLDKLTKYATAHRLKDRTWVSIIEGLKERVRYLGKSDLIVTDNELDVLMIKQFLKDNNINLHLTTKYNKTGNADIERLHQTLNEHIRLFSADIKNNDDLETQVHNAIIFYNNTIHSTHKKDLRTL